MICLNLIDLCVLYLFFRVCNEQLNPDYVHARSSKVVIMVFISDGSVTANGINIDWTWS